MSTATYQVTSPVDDPYSSLIDEFLWREFPVAAAPPKQSLLEIITGILLGTNQNRYGPIPKPEALVTIRAVIRQSLELGKAIPVLVPWGGRKAKTGAILDVAEVMALKQLACLYRQVREVFTPSIQFNLRVEDINAEYLYQEDGPVGAEMVEEYSQGLSALVRILNLHFVNPVREKHLTTYEAYFALADQIQDAMYEYLVDSDQPGYDRNKSKSWAKLQDLGWSGEIPTEQREYYRRRYRAWEPGITEFAANVKLARYFAGALARYKLRASGADKSWTDYIQISFTPPVPGAPESFTNRMLYYRTIVERLSRNHMPPWRGRGYIAMIGRTAVPKLASFQENLSLISHQTRLSRNGEDVDVDTSYLVKQ